jgi:uncharacterized membrane protein YccF (DUF307 family)
MGLAWCLAGVLIALTIIGLPWAGACFRIAGFTFMPFGREAVSRHLLTGREDLGTGPIGAVLNIIWLVFLGLPLAIGHLLHALVLAVTIIGIPFAWQHVKLAGLSLWPVGTEVVDAGVADAARRRAAYL